MSMAMSVLLVIVLVVILIVWVPKREGMAYLDQYEMQDNYRNVPESWPVVYTSTTALYAAKRKELAEEAYRREIKQCSSGCC